MSANMTPEHRDFRNEVDAWVNDNFPESLRSGQKQEQYYQYLPRYPEGDDFADWKQRVVAKGWGAPNYPTEYGGAGLPMEMSRTILKSFVQNGAYNPVQGMGTSMLGPTLVEYGNDEQRAQHLTGIATGTVRWCQGYSEPGSGSDLASLQTKAEDKGDHYLVNGQKIWTSGSLWAHWMFCLVRTDPTVKHDGISFILIDMKTPGVEVRPIRIISGQSPFSEVFFTDVVVPKKNLVGELNRGWTIAKRLLQFERDATTNNRRQLAGDVRPIDEIAKDYIGVDEHGRIAEPELRSRVVKHMMNFKSLTLMQARMLEMTKAGQGPDASTSVVKNARAQFQQEREELLVEIMGYRGLGWEDDGFDQVELDTTRAFLSNKAMSIYSGTHEIQNNIIAKRMLGLLDHQ
jgi:alkylation response protein AidB-like acyl-CoA dehydrogenase